MHTHGLLICPECGRPAEAGPPADRRPAAATRWRHRDDLTPLCPTTAVHPSDRDIADVPAGRYGQCEIIQAGQTMQAAATYLDRALDGVAAQVVLPRPDDLTALLTQVHLTTSRLAGIAAAGATRARQLAGHADTHTPGGAALARILADRLADASAHLTLTARTLHGVANAHHDLHHQPAPHNGRAAGHAPTTS
jgi:hypothetical protein